MRYSVAKIPNTSKYRSICDKLIPDGWRVRRRGRGHRYGVRYWHASLPLDMASRYTMYCQSKEYDSRKDGWEITYFDFVGLKEDGRPILRLKP